ncbi:hypothetical protein [Macrococcus animalis]|uniref:DUF2483 family protein n=1 Tax=Macrococcus animalis TaxID=3395467 RepID=UPI0039BE0FAD
MAEKIRYYYKLKDVNFDLYVYQYTSNNAMYTTDVKGAKRYNGMTKEEQPDLSTHEIYKETEITEYKHEKVDGLDD